MSWWQYEASHRLPANGIRARTGARQAFGETWWGRRWMESLERFMDSGRLQRGRSYARSGQVLSLDIAPGRIDARVQGSRPTPYAVRIGLVPFDDAQWEAVVEAMAGQARFAAGLLAGEMPKNIEEAFEAAEVHLFPATARDLVTNCSCPDWANPCKHVAAVYLLLAEQFDDDPFLLFRLRGRERDEIVRELRRRRGTGSGLSRAELPAPVVPPEPAGPPLEECLDSYWSAGELPRRLPLNEPPVTAGPVKQLGPPPFWQDDEEFTALMERLYGSIGRAAIDLIIGA